MARELNTRFIRIAVIAPAEIPESKMIWKERGNSAYSSPETVGNRPMPSDMATTRMLALLNLTRELLYTAVTRAKDQVLLIGAVAAIRRAVLRPANRASGLRHRLG